MSEHNANDPLLDMYIFETVQNIDQLESSILETEKSSCYTSNAINEVFHRYF